MQTHLTINRMIADWQKRGVRAQIEHTTTTEGMSVVPYRKIWLQGSQMPHDLDGVKRFREQLLKLADEGKPLGAEAPATRAPQHRFSQPPQRLVFPRDLPKFEEEEGEMTPSLPKPKRAQKQRTTRIATPKKAQVPREPLPKRFYLQAGETYHAWTVLEVLKERNARGAVMALCRCVCGKERPVETSSLTRKRKPSQSCGCLHRGRPRIVLPDAGERFGEWTVIDPTVGRDRRNGLLVLVRCSCGTERKVLLARLRKPKGSWSSCGHHTKFVGGVQTDLAKHILSQPVRSESEEEHNARLRFEAEQLTAQMRGAL